MSETSGEIPQLHSQHEMVARQVIAKIGKPTLLPLTSKDKLSSKALSTGTKQLERVQHLLEQYNASPLNPKQLNLSPWALYCLLNLNGSVELNADIANAIRFGHIEIGKNTPETQLNKDALTQAFTEAFKQKFPWKKDGQGVDDKRLESVDLENPIYVELENGRQTMHDAAQVEGNKKRPTILFIKQETGKPSQTTIEDERKLVLKYSNGKPFVVVCKQYEDYTQVHFICNHEYMDGIPVAFYTKKIIDQLGLQSASLADIDKDTLKQIFQDSDYREYANPHGAYRVKTTPLGPETTQSIVKLYHEIQAKNPNISLSFESFWQLFLLGQHVDGQNIKGGVLKFSPEVVKQLDLYSAGNAKGLMQALLEGNTAKLQSDYSSYLVQKGDKQVLGLYRPNEALMAKLLTPLKHTVPHDMWANLNLISKKMGADKGLSGQVMTSIVPDCITIGGETVQLGSGFGGPACTEYQQAATTSTIVKDGAGQIVDIIVRKKYQKEDTMGTFLEINKK